MITAKYNKKKAGESGCAIAVFGKSADRAIITVSAGESEDGKGIMMIEGRVLKPKDKIYDLVDVLGVEDFSATPARSFPEKGRGREKIYDLVDVVERKPRMALVDAGLRDEIMKRASEIAEKISREIIPSVAERVIREEIEKLKRDA